MVFPWFFPGQKSDLFCKGTWVPTRLRLKWLEVWFRQPLSCWAILYSNCRNSIAIYSHINHKTTSKKYATFQRFFRWFSYVSYNKSIPTAPGKRFEQHRPGRSIWAKASLPWSKMGRLTPSWARLSLGGTFCVKVCACVSFVIIFILYIIYYSLIQTIFSKPTPQDHWHV